MEGLARRDRQEAIPAEIIAISAGGGGGRRVRLQHIKRGSWTASGHHRRQRAARSAMMIEAWVHECSCHMSSVLQIATSSPLRSALAVG